VMGEIIMLMRGIWDKSRIVHEGGWMKSAKDSYEIRGKVLGIVGYGHIGTQLSVIAEALGMRVRFFDVQKKLALGNAHSCRTLDELLTLSDVVSLHVPDTAQTRNMIGPNQLKAMKKGSYLINAARGSIIDIDALADALKSRHLLGAAIDVFPEEPAGDADEFVSPLRNLPNVILTPHIGGSTLEAQANIGNEVARKLIEYSDNGSTMGAVNFPEVQLPVRESGVRFLHIHGNVPGILRKLNEVFASRNLNMAAQYLKPTLKSATSSSTWTVKLTIKKSWPKSAPSKARCALASCTTAAPEPSLNMPAVIVGSWPHNRFAAKVVTPYYFF